MKRSFALTFLFSTYAFFNCGYADSSFFESDKFQDIKARYCASPSSIRNKKPNINDLKKELCKGENGNLKKVVKLYKTIMKNHQMFAPKMEGNFLSYENFNFHNLAQDEKDLFIQIMMANNVCESLDDISISKEGICKIKMTNAVLTSQNGEAQYKQQLKECHEFIEFFAVSAALKSAGCLLTASSVSGCLLAIEALKAQARINCENNPENWWEITKPLREFAKSAVERN